MQRTTYLFSRVILILIIIISSVAVFSQQQTDLNYTVSAPRASSHYFHVELFCSHWNSDTVEFKMPKWTPGYYQIMDFAKEVENLKAASTNGNALPILSMNGNTWRIVHKSNQPFVVSYDVKAEKKFVANSYVDSTHGYIIPGNLFLYVNGHINIPVFVKIIPAPGWNKIVTGLETIHDRANEFYAPDFDILYDSPILEGKLEELPSFTVNQIEHRFIGFDIGEFEKQQFMDDLKKVVEAAVSIIGDIPYKQYTFIGIGPGRGGIEHLNNTTVSFSGKDLNSAAGKSKMMNFLAHEYFHHYNVKRIRPFELGPFDYDRENRTNLLWVSEGLSVYYEYMIVKRAGLVDEQTLFGDFEHDMNAIENNPGRQYQSLAQAGYETWSDGPFGKQGADANKSISYYEKGPLIGLIFDFAIRHATQNKKSLDDVMRFLYWEYYKKKNRGFTDAEFQQACETVAGISLNDEFEYVYTTKEPDYNKYLGYAGLAITFDVDSNGKKKFSIKKPEKTDELQNAILQAWLTK